MKSFKTDDFTQEVLKGININIYEGDFTVIMGSSGAGKSTLLYSLSGIDRPTGGEIIFNEKDITGYSEDQLALFRRKNCGFVFQQIYLLDNMSIMDNVITSGMLGDYKKKEIIERAKSLFQKVNISESIQKKFPSQLSGGEAQRCGIVRALINKPSILFADEPTGALNSKNGQAVLDMLTLANEEGQSIIMVTHDLKSARRGNRIIYLKDGLICGECNLSKYSKNDEKRNEELDKFLSEMGW